MNLNSILKSVSVITTTLALMTGAALAAGTDVSVKEIKGKVFTSLDSSDVSALEISKNGSWQMKGPILA